MNQPLAYVHPQAEIANNVVIEPFVVIDKNVSIGEGTWIGSHVTIMEGATIGNNCKIFPGAVISAIPQDLKFKGESTVTIIGDNVTIRECVTINRGTIANNETRIGDGCLLMAYVHIAHDSIVSNNCILANGVTLAGHITIDEYAIIGGLTAIHQFVHIGAHAMISGGSLVRKDVPPFTKAAREPLMYSGINSIGLRRRGFDSDQINAIQDIYRILYVKGYNNTKALYILETEYPVSKERDEIISFIRNSERGIMKGYSPQL
ncbi:MAG: acyl-ACP--UDP-N-acetylglucosamine O-acyltransferase [Flavobacteriales bacterium]|nr:acyl-ACP--UDP-N-acetylglucosamine O-acyltransferase [Flavobacteriales bacterium]